MTDTVVVGHGRTPEGRGWGAKIDSCYEVVRMWDCEWQPLIDYGEKYDVGYFELSSKQWAWFSTYNTRFPTKCWVGGILKPFEWKLPDHPRTYTIHMGRWIELGYQHGGVGTTGKLKLTRGCVAAAWAAERMTKGDRLILVGFDNVYTGQALTPEEGFSEVYRKAPSTRPFKNYVGGGTKYHNHDYVAEGDILKHVTEVRGVELKHAQEIW